MADKKYYAVKNGRKNGIYETWDECKNQTCGFSNAQFKSFICRWEAVEYLGYDPDVKTAPAKKKRAKKTAEAVPIVLANEATAYVDGSYNTDNKLYGYGVVLNCEGTDYEFSGCGYKYPKMRNVSGEIDGAMRAITEAIALGCPKITIYYDYTGIECWANDSWSANKPGTIAYKQFIKESRKRIEICFCKVKAHTGVVLNERVDKLAKASVGLSACFDVVTCTDEKKPVKAKKAVQRKPPKNKDKTEKGEIHE